MIRWVFDLGNTRLKGAPLEGDGRPGEVVAVEHGATDPMAAIARLLPSRIDVAYVASVAGDDLGLALLQMLAGRCTRISIARTPRSWGDLRIAYADPSRLGVDRFLAMLAVRDIESGPALVCGVGTALTVDLIDAGGRHRGGRIAPSPTLMRQSLHQRAGHLPAEGGRYREFADDSLDGLASGCEGAALGLIERSLLLAERDLGRAPALFLHGGGAAALEPHLAPARLVPTLVLVGLARWAAADLAPG